MRTTDVPGIEEIILKGLEHTVAKYFGVDKTFFVSTTDRNARMALITDEKDKSLLFPAIFLSMARGSLSETYNARSMRRHGTYTGLVDEFTVGKSHIVPVDMEIDIELATDSFTEFLKYFKMWFLAVTSGPLNFNVDYDGLSVLIRVEVAPDLVVPKRDVSLDSPSYYEGTGQLLVHGYISPSTLEHVPTYTYKTSEIVNSDDPTIVIQIAPQ